MTFIPPPLSPCLPQVSSRAGVSYSVLGRITGTVLLCPPDDPNNPMDDIGGLLVGEVLFIQQWFNQLCHLLQFVSKLMIDSADI